MMRPIVLDASVAMSLVHNEPESGRWRAITSGWAQTGRRIVVPTHFWPEVANVLMRRHGYDGAATLEAIHALDEVVVETVPVDRALLVLAIDQAERFGLSVYDAVYLALADAIDAELATMDRALARAAGPRLVSRERPGHHLSETRATYGEAPRVTWPDYSGAAAYLASLRAEVKRREARQAATGRAGAPAS